MPCDVPPIAVKMATAIGLSMFQTFQALGVLVAMGRMGWPHGCIGRFR